MDLPFQVPMQYCCLQHQTLLPSPVTSTFGCCFHFGSVSPFFHLLSGLLKEIIFFFGICEEFKLLRNRYVPYVRQMYFFTLWPTVLHHGEFQDLKAQVLVNPWESFLVKLTATFSVWIKSYRLRGKTVEYGEQGIYCTCKQTILECYSFYGNRHLMEDRYISSMLNVQALLNKISRVYCSTNN